VATLRLNSAHPLCPLIEQSGDSVDCRLLLAGERPLPQAFLSLPIERAGLCVCLPGNVARAGPVATALGKFSQKTTGDYSGICFINRLEMGCSRFAQFLCASGTIHFWENFPKNGG
jgi:hypothetical protein